MRILRYAVAVYGGSGSHDVTGAFRSGKTGIVLKPEPEDLPEYDAQKTSSGFKRVHFVTDCLAAPLRKEMRLFV